MRRVSDSCKEQIRSRVPLEELLREYNVALSPVGRRLRALCPFHAEKTPSFYVDVERQTYYCFGCQEHGDVFRFVQGMHHVDFPQALELLARRCGVPLDNVPGGGRRSSDPSIVQRYDVLQLACDHYHRLLMEDPAGREAREYLQRRGIERASWEKFQLGYSLDAWEGLASLAAKKGVKPELLESVGLARRRERGGVYDYFRGRLMFPVRDPQGRVIGFGARTLGSDQPKYLNSPGTSLFDKSRILYGLTQARAGIHREGRVGIMEGYTDVIMAHQAGLDFFVASLGTAFTRENARSLGRLAPRVLLMFDGDTAGQKASERSLDLLVAENLDVRVCTMPGGRDPCESIALEGADRFRRRFEEESLGIFEFKWRCTVESPDADAGGPALQARALDEFLQLVARVPNVVARKLHIREFSEKLGVAEEDIAARLQHVMRRTSRFRSSPAGGGQGTPVRKWRPGPGGFTNEVMGEASAAGPAGPAAGTDRGNAVEWDTGGGPEVGRRRGAGRRAIGTERQQELEELILECILALPEKAESLLAKVPDDFFEDPALSRLVDATKRQLKAGAFSPSRLLDNMEDGAEARVLLAIMSRLQDDRGGIAADYEDVWRRLQRDLWRHEKQRRLEELKALMSRDSAGAEGEKAVGGKDLNSVRREYFETLRELKKSGGR